MKYICWSLHGRLSYICQLLHGNNQVCILILTLWEKEKWFLNTFCFKLSIFDDERKNCTYKRIQIVIPAYKVSTIKLVY
jgi:hypothetical protein